MQSIVRRLTLKWEWDSHVWVRGRSRVMSIWEKYEANPRKEKPHEVGWKWWGEMRREGKDKENFSWTRGCPAWWLKKLHRGVKGSEVKLRHAEIWGGETASVAMAQAGLFKVSAISPWINYVKSWIYLWRWAWPKAGGSLKTALWYAQPFNPHKAGFEIGSISVNFKAGLMWVEWLRRSQSRLKWPPGFWSGPPP